jgi:RNA ligase
MKYKYLDILLEAVDKGYVTTQKHPYLPLVIYNYTRLCQFEKMWNPATLSARGLILDTNGNFVAKGLDKFFNYEELGNNPLPNSFEYVYRQEKADGSFGIIFYYQNEWVVATRGSFQSEQAIKALDIMKKYNPDKWIKDFIYLTEIIYPSNRIVVNYDRDEKLLFISTLDKNGDELNWATTKAILNSNGISEDNLVKTTLLDKLTIDDVKKSQLEDLPNMEGYVYRFYPNGERFKSKFPTYVEKHKILTNISNIDIWNLLKDGKDPLTLLDEIPDELDNWLKSELLVITSEYQSIENDVLSIFNSMNLNVDKKEFAFQVFKFNKRVQPLLFRLYDKKDYSDIIWTMIKPKYKTPWMNEDCTL